jgi:hypothetical protein
MPAKTPFCTTRGTGRRRENRSIRVESERMWKRRVGTDK